jgi:hypothetical protein
VGFLGSLRPRASTARLFNFLERDLKLAKVMEAWEFLLRKTLKLPAREPDCLVVSDLASQIFEQTRSEVASPRNRPTLGPRRRPQHA